MFWSEAQEKALSPAFWLRLFCVPGLGQARLRTLAAHFPEPLTIFSSNIKDLQKIGLPEAVAQALLTPSPAQEAAFARSWDWQRAAEQTLLHPGHPAYPSLLAEIFDPPYVLFAKGKCGLLSQPQLAIVGTRKPSAYGQQVAFDFAKNLSQQGLTITSGLALGIDAIAHQAALGTLGNTIAVIATGLEVIYPPQHRGLWTEILAQGGLIISEMPLTTTARPQFFPRRNRLISGLALGVLVVEAAEVSGSLITARLALEQGREVFAIPGSIYSPQSRGCHRLLQQGAALITQPQEVLTHLALPLQAVLQETAAVDTESLPKDLGKNATLAAATESPRADVAEGLAALPETIQAFYHRLPEGIFSPEVLCGDDLTIDRISAMLLQLELEGLVLAHPDGTFKRQFPP
jgi:DNA processing protein